MSLLSANDTTAIFQKNCVTDFEEASIGYIENPKVGESNFLKYYKANCLN